MQQGRYNTQHCSKLSKLVLIGLSAAALIVTLVFPQESWAAARCRVGATPINFGQYNDRTKNANGMIQLRCRQVGRPDLKERLITYRIRLSTGSSNSYRNRTLRQIGGPDRINYNIYIDSGRRLVWGNGSNGTQVVTGRIRVFRLRENKTERVRLYARIPGRQNVSAGRYSDVIHAFIDF